MQTYNSLVFKLHDVRWSEHIELFTLEYFWTKIEIKFISEVLSLLAQSFTLKNRTFWKVRQENVIWDRIFRIQFMNITAGTATNDWFKFSPNLQIIILKFALLTVIQRENIWSPSVLNNYVYYRKGYGQMYYIINCKYVFYIPCVREFFSHLKQGIHTHHFSEFYGKV